MQLSIDLESSIEIALSSLGRSLKRPKELADDIQKLSDFYIQSPGRPTPWAEAFAAPATLAYFMPLNILRLERVLQEVKRFIPFEELKNVVDFGSGTGATQFAIETLSFELESFVCIELASTAKAIHRSLHASRGFSIEPSWQDPAKVNPKPKTLGVFSYSYLEIQPDFKKLKNFDHLLVVEPSTQLQARKLMQARKEFIEKGFSALAPCTHQQDCPLLTQSAKDWCHTRVGFDQPKWFSDIENHLPMRNQSVSFSYLLLSRTLRAIDQPNSGRVIGEPLVERGKTRQLYCRGSKREFLSWLHRHGQPPELENGLLVTDVNELGSIEEKATEIRIKL